MIYYDYSLHLFESRQNLFFGQFGELRDRAFEDQMHQASCLLLLTAIISAWNTVYVHKALNSLESNGKGIKADYLPHIGPMGWAHLYLLGRYNFEPTAGHSLSNLRPLRQLEEETGLLV